MRRLKIILLAATQRGLFLLESDSARGEWRLNATAADPGWAYGAVTFDPANSTIYAAGQSAWYGPAVWRSPDLGQTWSLSSEGLTYGDGGPAVHRIWAVRPAHGRLYAGVDPAGIFLSEDGGQTWQELPTPLRGLPGSERWRPGKGGLPVHSILPHPDDPLQLWVGIAGGGVLHSGDAGRSWAPRNPLLASGQPALLCQKLAHVPGQPDHLVQQNHQGLFRSTDGGRTWRDCTAGLPTPFGFPIAAHAGDIIAIPHHNQAGVRYVEGARLAVWRSRDGGESWTRQRSGLPQETAYTSVLRDGLTTDSLGGVYFGTTSGSIYGSLDGGETWQVLAERLPEILAIQAAIMH